MWTCCHAWHALGPNAGLPALGWGQSVGVGLQAILATMGVAGKVAGARWPHYHLLGAYSWCYVCSLPWVVLHRAKWQSVATLAWGLVGQQPPLALVATMGAANTTVGACWPQYLPLEVP